MDIIEEGIEMESKKYTLLDLFKNNMKIYALNKEAPCLLLA